MRAMGTFQVFPLSAVTQRVSALQFRRFPANSSVRRQRGAEVNYCMIRLNTIFQLACF
jgi:hypothetical protein